VVLLDIPEEHPRKIYEEMNRISKGAYRTFNVLENFRLLEIYSPTFRKKWANNIKNDERVFSDFFFLERKMDEKEFFALKDQLLFPVYFKSRIREKALLTEFCKRNSFSYKERFEDLVTKLSYSESRYLLKEMLFAKARSLGILSKNSDIKQKIGTTSRGLMNSIDEANISGFKDLDDEITHLREENEDIKTSLFMTAKELDEIQGNFEDLKKEMEEQVVKDFFSKLNSQFYGSLLDQFLMSEIQLKQLKDSGYPWN